MNDIKKKLQRASEVYGDQLLVRASINAIPYVGSSLDILLSAMGQKFVLRRIENFIAELNSQLALLDSNKINHDFLTSEEGFDLIVHAFNSAARTRQRDKIKLYAKILKNALIEGKEYEEEEPEIYLRIIEELSTREFKVATLLYNKKVKMLPHESVRMLDARSLAKESSEFSRDELVFILVRLEKTGLIKEHMYVVHGSGGGSYQVNKLFVKFMDFIDASPAQRSLSHASGADAW